MIFLKISEEKGRFSVVCVKKVCWCVFLQVSRDEEDEEVVRDFPYFSFW